MNIQQLCAWIFQRVPKQQNSILVIEPYRERGVWRFDDKRVNLVGEPFVGDINRMIDRMVAHIPHARKGFTALFSATPFPKYDMHLVRVEAEHGGTWYHEPKMDLVGWLCPALFKYFPVAPKHIYVKAEALS